jgi:hypothetical protein
MSGLSSNGCRCSRDIEFTTMLPTTALLALPIPKTSTSAHHLMSVIVGSYQISHYRLCRRLLCHLPIYYCKTPRDINVTHRIASAKDPFPTALTDTIMAMIDGETTSLFTVAQSVIFNLFMRSIHFCFFVYPYMSIFIFPDHIRFSLTLWHDGFDLVR